MGRRRRFVSLGLMAGCGLSTAVFAQPVPVGSPARIDAFPTATDRSDVAADAAGNFVVVTYNLSGDGPDGSGRGVFGQRFDATGTALAPPFTVNTYTTGDQDEPTVARTPTGEFVVTWTSYQQDGSGWGIFARLFDAAGAALGGEIAVNSTTIGWQRGSDVAIDAAGNFVVTWTADATDVAARRFDASGTPLGLEFQVNTYTPGGQQAPAGAMDPNGGFWITWSSDQQDGSGRGIFAQRFDAAGTPAGGEFQVNSVTAGDQIDPGIAIDSTGTATIAWYNYNAPGGTSARRFDATGTPVGPQFEVSPDASFHPSIWTDASDDFIIAWPWSLRRYDASGTPLGPPFTQRGDGVVFGVVYDGLGGFRSLTASGAGIFAQRYGFDSPVGADLLKLREGSTPAKRKISFSSRDAILTTEQGAGMTPVTNGAYLHVYNDAGTGDSACMPLPASGWRTAGDPAAPSLIYSDPGFANGPCKTIRMRPTANGVLLKASCRSKVQPITYSLDEAQQSAVVVRLVSGMAEYCTRFDGGAVQSDASGLFVGRHATAGTSCPTPPSPCP